jgi:hypothetical protein
LKTNKKKLLIRTLVFNGLVTSSIRLDQIHPPEVGASTFLFSPTKETKAYTSHQEASNKPTDQSVKSLKLPIHMILMPSLDKLDLDLLAQERRSAPDSLHSGLIRHVVNYIPYSLY